MENNNNDNDTNNNNTVNNDAVDDNIVEKNSTVKNSKLNINNTLLVIVALLVVMSAVQIFQFQKITEALSNGAVNVNTQTSGNAVGLPSQVGGCG